MPVKTNIGEGANIRKDTATEAFVLNGLTFHAGKSQKQRTGTMPDKRGTEQNITEANVDTENSQIQMLIPAIGYYDTSAKLLAAFSAIRSLIGLTASAIATGTSILGITGTYKGLGDASASDVLTGKTFSTASLSGASGTMTDKTGTTQSATASLDSTNSRVQLKIPVTGKYNTSSYLYATYSTIASLIGLTAAKIATGITILGIAGSYKGVGTATAAKVLTGYTFSSASLSGASGSMADKSGTAQSATSSLDTTNSRLQLTIPATGYYDTSAKLYAAYSTIRTLIGLTTAKLGYGKTCLGLTGTYKPTVTQISASAACGFGQSSSESELSEEDSYTCTAAGTCYYNGFAASEASRATVTCEIYKNGTLVNSRNIDSSNSYAWRGTMQEMSFSVASGDVIKVVAAVTFTSASYSKMSHIDATIVTYT